MSIHLIRGTATIPRQDYWDKITDILRSRNVIPGNMSKCEVVEVVKSAYDLWQFYPSYCASIGTIHHRPGDEPDDEWFLQRIVDMLKCATGSSPAATEDETVNHDLRCVRARFDALPKKDQEAILEKARLILPPPFQNDADSVLFTALELFLNDGARATTSLKSLGKISAVVLVAVLLSSPFTAKAFWPFTNKKQIPPVIDSRPYGIGQVNYQDNFGDSVQSAAAETYVICIDCPEKTLLHRALKEVSLSMNLGTNPKATAAPAVLSRPVQTASGVVVSFASLTSERSSPPPSATGNKKEEMAKAECTDTTVYFDLNSAVVNKTERKKLLDHMDGMKQNRVTVSGYTCEIGSQSYNDKLALERATNIEAILQENGVVPAEVKAKGRCCYVSKHLARNRRVEITCVDKGRP